MNLRNQLDELDRIPNAHKRGRAFEPFIAHLLEEQGFDVTLNPNAAPPRQTDLCAQRDGVFFILEAKWQKRRTSTEPISSMQERLRGAPSDVFACMFCMSGYTKPAMKYVENHRSPELVLFDQGEIRGMVAGDLTFSDLLARKRQEMRTQATIWFAEWKPKIWHTGLHAGEPEILRIADHSAQWWLSRTQGDDVIFAREILDLGSYSDSAVSLRFSLEIRTPDDLLRTLHHLKHQIHLSGGDSFAIHQRSAGWYGSGIENFVEATTKWEDRYNQLNWPSYHHSEELALFDRIEGGGFLGLTLRQRIGEKAFLHSCHIEILLSGVPVDCSVIRRVCEKTGNQDARFEMVKKNPIQTHRFHPFVDIEVLGVIVDRSEEEYACGVIAKNPFYKPNARGSFDASGLGALSPVRFLSNTELLFCRLKSWHPAAKPMDRYHLLEVEASWIEELPVLYIACDW